MRRILRADYEADQATLKREFDALLPFVDRAEVGAEARYWRGFARWRAGINGWNDGMPPAEIAEHTAAAADEFAKAIERDPAFADARAAMAICRATLLFSAQPEPPDKMDRLRESSSELKRALNENPENPRTLWLVGGTYFWTPPEQGGSVDKAVSIYEKGLAAARRAPAAPAARLRPTWGEPELLMSLAYARLNQPTPDLDAAEKFGREALAQVPYWHYLRDILMKQIGDARAAAAAAPAATPPPPPTTTPMI
jgi:tetratricopeptide (TPR) repeat protein